MLIFQKSTKKPRFAALLKQKFYFVPRGTNAPNFFEHKKIPLNCEEFEKCFLKLWSGLRDSNSPHPPWEGGALPDELNPQSALQIRHFWRHHPDLNRG